MLQKHPVFVDTVIILVMETPDCLFGNEKGNILFAL